MTRLKFIIMRMKPPGGNAGVGSRLLWALGLRPGPAMPPGGKFHPTADEQMCVRGAYPPLDQTFLVELDEDLPRMPAGNSCSYALLDHTGRRVQLGIISLAPNGGTGKVRTYKATDDADHDLRLELLDDRPVETTTAAGLILGGVATS